jgi:hypothetical protein
MFHNYTLDPKLFEQVNIRVVPGLLPRWAAAQVWGRTILLRRDMLERSAYTLRRLIAHELMHVVQYEHQGKLAFWAGYAYDWVTSGFSYKNMSLEHEAQLAAQEPFFLEAADKLLARQPWWRGDQEWDA